MYINWLTNNTTNTTNNSINHHHMNKNTIIDTNYQQTITSSYNNKRLLETNRMETNGNSNNNNNTAIAINHQSAAATATATSSSSSSFNIINIVQSCSYRYTSQTSVNGDVIVEVAHGSTHVRYLAHSTVLAMHSGYLRSAIRLDDRLRPSAITSSSYHSPQTNNNNNGNRATSSNPSNLSQNTPILRNNASVSGIGAGVSDDGQENDISNGGRSVSVSPGAIVLYLHNVTAEQFSPLLTYMYTGYLDLNCENIFSVLLATHVLHMPRALEICR